MTEIHLSDDDREFIEELVAAGYYKNADAVVAGGLRLLQQKNKDYFELQRLIQEGLDDVEAGRVYRYSSAEDMLTDIKQMAADKKTGTGY